MAFNLTAAFLAARRSPVPLFFSASLGSSSVFLDGPGGLAGDGYPLPFAGRIEGLRTFDGLTQQINSSRISFSAGDRLCVYATWTGGSSFTIAVVVNGTLTAANVSGIASGSTIYASVPILFEEA